MSNTTCSMEFINIVLKNQTFILHPHKAIFWKEQNTLLISDLHLGKVAHFRKKGFAVPAVAGQVDLDKLAGLLLQFQPEKVIFLGDLFHSIYNRAWEDFSKLLVTFKGIAFVLVQGNHDILNETLYSKMDIAVHTTYYVDPFLMTHEPLDTKLDNYYNLAGHLHPGVYLQGLGRQKLRLPCFYFGEHQAILPAFGNFTGLFTIAPTAHDQIFVIADDKVIAIKNN